MSPTMDNNENPTQKMTKKWVKWPGWSFELFVISTDLIVTTSKIAVLMTLNFSDLSYNNLREEKVKEI